MIRMNLEKRVEELEKKVKWLYDFLNKDLKEINKLSDDTRRASEKILKKCENVLETQDNLTKALKEKMLIKRKGPT